MGSLESSNDIWFNIWKIYFWKTVFSPKYKKYNKMIKIFLQPHYSTINIYLNMNRMDSTVMLMLNAEYAFHALTFWMKQIILTLLSIQKQKQKKISIYTLVISKDLEQKQNNSSEEQKLNLHFIKLVIIYYFCIGILLPKL